MERNALICFDLELSVGGRSGAPRTVLSVPRLTIAGQGITALVGPNGSGKSSLLGVFSGLVKPTTGSVRLGERETYDEFDAVKHDVQLVSHEAPLYDDLTVGDYLDLFARKSLRWNAEISKKLADAFPLPRKLAVRQLSTGERTKLRMRLVLPTLPKVVLVDELTNELDTDSRRAVYRELDAYSFEHDALVVVATNVLGDIERYASHVVMLSGGRLVLDESLDALKERHRRLVLRRIGGSDASPEGLAHLRLVWDGRGGEIVTHRYTEDFPELLATMGIEGIPAPLSLEEVTAFYVGGVVR